MSNEKKICFVIAPIGSHESDIRKRADQILRHLIKPAAQACGFDAIRADEISEPGIITSQVVQHIVDDPLVIADLTGSNPNVFYELAIRHAIRKPLVQIIQKDEKLPFDLAGMRTIEVDHKDLDSVEQAKLEIQKQINVTVKKNPEDTDSPISVSLELQALRQSDNPEKRSLADIVTTISYIRNSITRIESLLNEPKQTIPIEFLESIFKRLYNVPSLSLEQVNEVEDLLKLLENTLNKEAISSDSTQEIKAIVSHIRDLIEFKLRDVK